MKRSFCNFIYYAYISLAVILTLIVGTAMPVFPLGLEKVDVITPSGLDTGLLSPSGFCYDGRKDFLIVANTEAHQVAVLNRQGIALKVLGRSGGLRFPMGVAVTRDGRLFIAERGREGLKVLAEYDSGTGEEYRELDLSVHRRTSSVQPAAIHVNDDGYLYVADRGNRQALVFGSDEKFKFLIPDVGEPTDIWASPGKIFVSDPAFGGIRVYSDTGGRLPTLGISPSQFREPLRVRSLAVDLRQRIWIIEEPGQTLRAIDSLGNLLFSIPAGSAGREGLFAAVDLAIDRAGNLFVLEQGGNRISVFRIMEF